jgi:hypothetical protein
MKMASKSNGNQWRASKKNENQPINEENGEICISRNVEMAAKAYMAAKS